MTDFIETPRFPDNISYGSQGGPGFKTFVFEGYTGIEQRSITWSRAKGKWNVSHGIRDKDDMDTLRAFFYEVRGRAIGFRFKDWGDYEIVQQNLGAGDGVVVGMGPGRTGTSIFQIIKTYGTTNAYTRRIFKPIISSGLEVRVGSSWGAGTPITRDPNSTRNPTTLVVTGLDVDKYHLDTIRGEIIFGTNVIPLVGDSVFISCEFDVPCRFDTDEMSAAHDGWLTESWSNIPVVELLLDIT